MTFCEQTMKRNKETAIADFMELIEKSWTWARLTDEEKKYFREDVNAADYNGAIKGTFEQRWHILQWMYSAFLTGCGYRNGSFRETREDREAPQF